MRHKERSDAPVRGSFSLTGPEAAQWLELLEIHGSHGAVIRDLLARHAAAAQDYTGAIIGWSEIRTATKPAECVYCDLAIEPGQQYRAADTIGNVGGVFAHAACEESD